MNAYPTNEELRLVRAADLYEKMVDEKISDVYKFTGKTPDIVKMANEIRDYESLLNADRLIVSNMLEIFRRKCYNAKSNDDDHIFQAILVDASEGYINKDSYYMILDLNTMPKEFTDIIRKETSGELMMMLPENRRLITIKNIDWYNGLSIIRKRDLINSLDDIGLGGLV